MGREGQVQTLLDFALFDACFLIIHKANENVDFTDKLQNSVPMSTSLIKDQQ